MSMGRFIVWTLVVLAVGVDGKKKKAAAFPGIVTQIGCAVCKEGVTHWDALIKYKREQKAPVKLKEDEIQELLEGSCDARRNEGRWLRYFDIVAAEDKTHLDLHDVGYPSKINKKVRSMEEACHMYLLGDSDISAFLYVAKKSVKAMSTYLCTNGGDSGEKGPCHKKFKRAVPTAKLLKDLPATKMVEASEQELGGESQVADNLKKMPHMPEEALQMYTRDDVEELAIDEMMKEGMDEEEARTMYRELKDSGYFDNPSEHLHHVTENDETAPTNTHSEDEYVGGDL